MRNHVFTLILLPVLCLTVKTSANEFVVRPYLQHVTKTSVVVLWETQEAAMSIVEYGLELPLNRKTELPGIRKMHEVVITGLEPQSNYFYRVTSVVNGQVLQSDVYTFQTSVRDESAFAFAIVSDTQTNPEVWGTVSQLIWGERPNFVMHAGDIVGTGSDKEHWVDHFFRPSHNLMSRVPVFTIPGNHEGDDPFYYQYMSNPEPEYYYTFKFGNAQFFMIDSNHDIRPGSDQYNMFEWDLAKSTARWKFVVHHHPPYTSDENDYGDTYKEKSFLGDRKMLDLIPLYESYQIDIVFFGHIHDYERTWPVYRNRIDQDKGVLYIQTGGGGGGLEDYAPTRSWFTKKVHRDHHFCLVNIHEGSLDFQAIDQKGNLFDQMTLSKLVQDVAFESPPPPAPIISPKSQMFEDELTFKIEPAFDNLSIYFSTDGTEPDKNFPVYTKPVTIKSTARIRAVAIDPAGRLSRSNVMTYRSVEPIAPVILKEPKPGLKYSYYEGTGWEYLPDFSKLEAVQSGYTDAIDIQSIKRADEQWAVVFEGFVHVPDTGIYTFVTNSDDGSRLYIYDELIVDNDGSHAPIRKLGQASLQTGWHPIRIEYFDDYHDEVLQVFYSGPDFSERKIPASAFSYIANE